MGETKIQWTNVTWNCVRGCSRVSSGCGDSTGGGCYAERQAYRFSGPGMPYQGLVKMTAKGPRWTGKVILDAKKLEEPLHWKKPRMVFVNSMSDLFHESLTDTQIQNVFTVMESARHHVYQVLTKRPQRMLEFVSKFDEWLKYASDYPGHLSFDKRFAHVWLGVSVEDQKTADERIPLLLQTPAAVRWISAEPLLAPVDLRKMRGGTFNALDGIDFEDIGDIRDAGDLSKSDIPGLDWVVVGGESGLKSRPFDLAWARSIVEQCKAANVPVFVKQIGAHPISQQKEERPWEPLFHDAYGRNPTGEYGIALTDKKGGSIGEWPIDLRVREFPSSVTTQDLSL